MSGWDAVVHGDARLAGQGTRLYASLGQEGWCRQLRVLVDAITAASRIRALDRGGVSSRAADGVPRQLRLGDSRASGVGGGGRLLAVAFWGGHSGWQFLWVAIN